MPPETAAPETGRVPVRDHQLECVIGRGAYGEVWLARSVLGTARAVKIVWRNRFDHVRPFEREFHGIQQCEPLSRQHAGLVDILQVGRDEDGGWFYYIMELADALSGTSETSGGATCYQPRTLRSELATRGRLPVSEVAALGAQLAEALAFLHAEGLVHRDLKPSNVLFIGGQPKLGDIGLVSQIGGDQSYVGTHGYIAPEGPGTPAADLFALGLVLYEAATGLTRHDFPQLPPALAQSAEAEDFAELNAILLRACAADPKQRYPSAQRMRDDLHALTGGRSVRRLRELERRLRRVRMVGVMLALAGLSAGAGWLWQRQQAHAAREEVARETRHVAALEAKERELRLNLYAADMSQAGEAIRAGNLGRARELLAQWSAGEGQDDLRDPVWHFLAEAARGSTHRVFTGHSRNVSGLALAPDGATLFSCGFDGTVRAWDLATGSGQIIAQKPGEPFYEIARLPDGDFILGGSTALWRWRTGAGEWNRLGSGAARHLGVGASGEWVAAGGKTQFFGPDEPVEIVPLNDARDRRTLAERSGRCAVSADGQWLATGEADGLCAIYRTATWERARTFEAPGQIVALTFSRDGQHLAATLREGDVALWEVATGALLFRREAHARHVVWCAAFSPDGQRLATGGSDQSIHLWNVPARRLERVLRGHEDEVWSVLFGADGRFLASSGKDETVRIWPLDLPESAPVPEQLAGRAVISPDSRWVAALEKDKALRVFDAATLAPVATLGREETPLAFSADGETLLTTVGARTLTRWSWRTGEERGMALAAGGGPAGRIALSPDEQWLAACLSDGALVVWSAVTGEIAFREILHGAVAHELAFSPDSRWLGTTHSDFCIRLRAAGAWETQTQIAAHKMRTAALAFSPDSQLLASASWDGTAGLWDVRSGQRLVTFRGHTTSLQDIAFFPGGKLLAILEGDASIAFWDLRSQRASARLPAPIEESNHNLAVAPDASLLIATKLTGSRPGVWRAKISR